MTSQVVISLVALATAVGTAAFTAIVQGRARRQEDERQRQTTVDRYREPLAQSVFQLQSRLWNMAVMKERFHDAYVRPTNPTRDREDVLRSEYAVTSTLWLLGEYLCWIEILRREVQFLHSSDRRDPMHIGDQVSAITRIFAADEQYTDELKIFRSHQRAIGELMMVRGFDGNGVERTGVWALPSSLSVSLMTSLLAVPNPASRRGGSSDAARPRCERDEGASPPVRPHRPALQSRREVRAVPGADAQEARGRPCGRHDESLTVTTMRRSGACRQAGDERGRHGDDS